MDRQTAPTPVPGPADDGFAESATYFAPVNDPPLTLRGRAERFGASTLTDREIVTAILAASDPLTAEAGAAALTARFRSLEAMLAADLCQLSVCAGTDAALTLKLAHELSARAAREVLAKREVISSWAALIAYLRARLAGRTREAIHVIYLDRKNQLIADEQLSEGTVDWAPMRPREIIRRALELSASALAIAHVHPSGSPTPSQADIDVTRELVAAARTMGIAVHDHVIVGEGAETSFKSQGLI